jgi:ABC-2 type transport system permease protein
MTYLTVLRISIAERLTYRVDFALGTLMRFLPIVTQMFLWFAVYQGATAASGSKTIAGYSYENMIAYYLLTMLGRAFSSMPGLSSSIARDIREGTIKKYLLQPVDMLGFLISSRLAHKLVYYGVAFVPFAFVFWLCRGYFSGWPDAATMLAFLASLVLAFLLGFFLEATLGMIGFWFLEVSSLLFVYMLVSFFFSGQMFPPEIMPPYWTAVMKIIPLQYLAYFPAAVFLHKVSGAELAWGLVIEVLWVAFFYLAARVLFHYGVRRYSAFGG